MRTIKFRGKCLDDGRWAYGNLVILGTGQVYIIPQNVIANNIPQYSVDPETVGQYTGLKDKNGKEMYEGDTVDCITHYYSGNLIVVFQEGEFIMKRHPSAPGCYALRCFTKEVIGNIYQDPEIEAMSEREYHENNTGEDLDDLPF